MSIWLPIIFIVIAYFTVDSHLRKIVKRLESIESILMGRGPNVDER